MEVMLAPGDEAEPGRAQLLVQVLDVRSRHRGSIILDQELPGAVALKNSISSRGGGSRGSGWSSGEAMRLLLDSGRVVL